MWTPHCSARSPRLLALALILLGLATGGCEGPDSKDEQCIEIVLPHPQDTITVDGETGDWVGIAPQLTHPEGKQSAGQFRITGLSVATDDENIYLRIDIATDKTPSLYPGCNNNQICQSDEDLSCDDCVPQLRIHLKTNGFRQGQISPRRSGSDPSDPWRCEGNWNDPGGGTSISCRAAPKTTPEGLVFELSFGRTDLGSLVSIYPVVQHWQEYDERSIVDDEIGCVWAHVNADHDLGVDAPAADGGADAATDVSGPDLGGDTGLPPILGSWVTIPAGTFTMGSQPSDACYETNQDSHEVTLTHGFEMQDTEVTQAQFKRVMGYNPATFTCGNNCPVERVNWHEAVAYCNALSKRASLLATCYQCTGDGANVTCSEASPYGGANIYTCPGYRLPTEAEWEYAYRAGSTSDLYNGPSTPTACHACKSDFNADSIAWYSCNSDATTHPVKQKTPNAWLLYDMAGNVWEWCHDWYQPNLGSTAVTDPWGPQIGSERLVRGGGWGHHAYTLRAAFRNQHVDPTKRSWNSGLASFGFRCVRSLTP